MTDDQPVSAAPWRPIHRRLSDAWAQSGMTVHLMLVTDDEPQRSRTACGGGLGQWITGAGEQVTCPECLETVHA